MLDAVGVAAFPRMVRYRVRSARAFSPSFSIMGVYLGLRPPLADFTPGYFGAGLRPFVRMDSRSCDLCPGWLWCTRERLPSAAETAARLLPKLFLSGSSVETYETE